MTLILLGVLVSALLYMPAWDYPIFADDYEYGSIGDRNHLGLGFVSILGGLTLAVSAYSTTLKAGMLAASGHKADAVFAEVSEYVRRADLGAHVGLVVTSTSPSYSVFRMAPFELIGPAAADEILLAVGREDVRLTWLGDEVRSEATQLRLEGTTLVAYVDSVGIVAWPDESPAGAAR